MHDDCLDVFSYMISLSFFSFLLSIAVTDRGLFFFPSLHSLILLVQPSTLCLFYDLSSPHPFLVTFYVLSPVCFLVQGVH